MMLVLTILFGLFWIGNTYGISGHPSYTARLTGDVAKGKPTRQSSTSHNGVPKRAVDGNLNSNWSGKSCTHTNKGIGQWWRVDLLRPFAVFEVKITSRGDCCYVRDIEIRVGNSDSYPKANALCSIQTSKFSKGETRRIMCNAPILGQYVFVILTKADWLTLCEVQVFALQGIIHPPLHPHELYTGNIAKGKPATQSSFGWSGVPGRAVDGNTNSNYGKLSCTHTQNDKGGPWWKVDLQHPFAVSKVKITNRGDCCWKILRNFEIRVGNIHSHPKANALCARRIKPMGQSETRSFTCRAPLIGRYVFVIMNIREYLTLCEVQVFAIRGWSYSWKILGNN